jgi:hypothetical protein
VADFRCLDFDMGLPPTSTWAPTQSNGATFSLSTAAAASAPNSFFASVPAASDATHQGAATLAWTEVAAAAIKSITVSAQVNPTNPGGVFPPWSGYVEVLCVKYNGADSEACLEYQYGSPSKLTIHWIYIPSAAAQGFCDLPALWTANVWNPVSLTLVDATGIVTVTLNGQTTMCNPSFGPGPDTSATVTIGPHADATTTGSWSGYIDDVVAYVSR